jgi:RNA polymerase sigma-70 factor (ECF subfamily)
MTMATIEDFEQRTNPFRRELLAHCYQMLGSVHDAEDLLQDTLLRAWRAFDRYDEERASLRTWLYRIATNTCLTALEKRTRRPLPTGLVGPSDDPLAPMVRGQEVVWLQPFPDAKLDPADLVASRGSLRLAVVAAMQLLPARQRAVLILRDVLDWSASEAAEALDTTTASVNSALQRARAKLGQVSLVEEEVDEPTDPERRALVDRYVEAFEKADVEALKQLLTDEVVLEMPPVLNWYVGRPNYGAFMDRVFAMRGPDWRMVRTAANGQPAVGAYAKGPNGLYEAHTLQVFTVTAAGISRTTVFQDADLFPLFELPLVLDI